MTIEYKWLVNKVTVVENNLISMVELTVTGTSDSNSASASYFRNLVRGDSFIPYEQLTEQQVLNWCFSPETITWIDQDGVEQSITKLLKDEGEAQVAGQIARQLAQKQSEPALPWANVAQPV